MKVLLDHCVPRPLLRHLTAHDVLTARSIGWDDLKNGELVARAEGEFEVMITADQNLRYQQNLQGRRLALLILPTNYTPTVLKMVPSILAALASIQPGEWTEIELPT